MSVGKIFEQDWKQSMIKEGLWCFRVRDNAMSYTESESSFTQDNPYDFLCYSYPNLFCQELKYTSNASISIQTTPDASKGRMIKYHQIKSLSNASCFDGVYAGFVLSFYNEKLNRTRTFYISIDDFLIFLQKEGKKSINILDVIKYNGILIEQNLMRTHYHYQVKSLLQQIVAKENNNGETNI